MLLFQNPFRFWSEWNRILCISSVANIIMNGMNGKRITTFFLGGGNWYSVHSVIRSDEGLTFETKSLRSRSDEGLTLETSAPPLLPYGGITYLNNSPGYPNLLCFNFPPTQHQFL